MPVPVTQLHVLNNLLQTGQNLNGLQRDMRRNAQTWKAAAQAASIPLGTLSAQMVSAGIAYQARLGWLTTYQTNHNATWIRMRDMYILLGGTAAEFNSFMNPMNAVANGLATGTWANYAAVVTSCDQILTAIDAPPNIWPE